MPLGTGLAKFDTSHDPTQMPWKLVLSADKRQSFVDLGRDGAAFQPDLLSTQASIAAQTLVAGTLVSNGIERMIMPNLRKHVPSPERCDEARFYVR